MRSSLKSFRFIPTDQRMSGPESTAVHEASTHLWGQNLEELPDLDEYLTPEMASKQQFYPTLNLGEPRTWRANLS